jgi:rod shape-determining protein MreD
MSRGYSGQLGGGFGSGSRLGGPGRAARQLNPGAWLLLPALAVAVASFLFAVPLKIGGLRLPEPVFALGLAFAWSLIRPSMVAPAVLLVLGLYLDLLWGAPLGMWPLALLLSYGAVAGLRPLMAGQGYAGTWAWYAAVVVIGLGAVYLFTTVDARVRPNIWAVLSQAFVTILLYPLVAWLTSQFEDVDTRFR